MELLKPYEIRRVEDYIVRSFWVFGFTTSHVPMYGIFYEDIEIYRGGLQAITKIAAMLNGAFNLGFSGGIFFEQSKQ